MRLKIDGHFDLDRDTNSMAILNTNRIEYENYLKRKSAMDLKKQDSQKIKEMEFMIEKLQKMIESMNGN